MSKGEDKFCSHLIKHSIFPEIYDGQENFSNIGKIMEIVRKTKKPLCIRELPPSILMETNGISLEKYRYYEKIEELANYEFPEEKDQKNYINSLKVIDNKNINLSQINIESLRIDFVLFTTSGGIYIVEFNGEHHFYGELKKLQRQIVYDTTKEKIAEKINACFSWFDTRNVESIELDEKFDRFITEHIAL